MYVWLICVFMHVCERDVCCMNILCACVCKVKGDVWKE